MSGKNSNKPNDNNKKSGDQAANVSPENKNPETPAAENTTENAGEDDELQKLRAENERLKAEADEKAAKDAEAKRLREENEKMKAEAAKKEAEEKEKMAQENEAKARAEAEAKGTFVSNDILQQILDSQKANEEENKALKEKIRQLELRKPAEQDKSTLDQDTVDDYMNVPVVFFAYTSIFSIHSYQLKKKNLIPPFGKIRFKPTIRFTSGTGMQAKVHAICEFKTHSKKEKEYLENSPDFGVKFFKTMTEEKNYNHAYADLLSKESARVASMSDQALIAAVSAEPRLTVSKDIKSMRTQLIQLRADDALRVRQEREDADLSKLMKDRESLTKMLS